MGQQTYFYNGAKGWTTEPQQTRPMLTKHCTGFNQRVYQLYTDRISHLAIPTTAQRKQEKNKGASIKLYALVTKLEIAKFQTRRAIIVCLDLSTVPKAYLYTLTNKQRREGHLTPYSAAETADGWICRTYHACTAHLVDFFI